MIILRQRYKKFSELQPNGAMSLNNDSTTKNIENLSESALVNRLKNYKFEIKDDNTQDKNI